MNQPHPLRIALIEDHVLFAESLATALCLEGYDARRVMIDSLKGPSLRLLPKIMQLRPQIALVDLDLAMMTSGLDLVRPLTDLGVKVVVVTSDADQARWGECVASGACRVIPKVAAVSDIMATARRIVNGLPTMTPAERGELIRSWQEKMSWERSAHSRLAQLTRREAEVLGMLMSGLQVSDIARKRFVSESTVRTQVKAVLGKLQVGSQLTAVGLAHRAHWSPLAATESDSAMTG